MTRTPPDMETAMNDSRTTHAITWEEQRAYEKEARDRERCYTACAAINPDNPAVVAEALPELVEATNKIANPIGDIKMPGGSLVPTEYIERLRSVLAKLKARP